MSTLREEIMYIVSDFKIDTSLTAEQRAEEIIKLFEKRIDELNLRKEKKKSLMTYGYFKALGEVKEMLK